MPLRQHPSNSFHRLVVGLLLAICWSVAPASAQQSTGTPGAPNATTTIDGRYLPAPPQPFGGEINLNAAQSKAYWPTRVVPPKDAPNILLIMTDDVGFAAPSTFGGVIPTPALDRIAKAGLRYTNFHSTSLCSPTRAALITGRNHHSVGLRRRLRGGERLSRLQQRDRPRERNDRTHSVGQRLSHIVVRQGPQHAGVGLRVRPGRSISGRPAWASSISMGSSAATTSQWQPNLFRNTTAIYPYVGNPSGT